MNSIRISRRQAISRKCYLSLLFCFVCELHHVLCVCQSFAIFLVRRHVQISLCPEWMLQNAICIKNSSILLSFLSLPVLSPLFSNDTAFATEARAILLTEMSDVIFQSTDALIFHSPLLFLLKAVLTLPSSVLSFLLDFPV